MIATHPSSLTTTPLPRRQSRCTCGSTTPGLHAEGCELRAEPADATQRLPKFAPVIAARAQANDPLSPTRGRFPRTTLSTATTEWIPVFGGCEIPAVSL